MTSTSSITDDSGEVLVVTGAGGIGEAVALRSGAGRTVLLADLNEATLQQAAERVAAAGIAVETQVLDLSDRGSIAALAARAAGLGVVTGLVHTAGVSPSQAPVRVILTVDLYGTAALLEEFAGVVAEGAAGVAISSMSGHWAEALDQETVHALANAPADELLAHPAVAGVERDAASAYSFAKHANALRVRGESLRWKARGARINSVSPGVILTPMSREEMSGTGDALPRMAGAAAAGRLGDPDEIAGAVAFLLGPDASYVHGTDLLVDGGVIAAMTTGGLPVPA